MNYQIYNEAMKMAIWYAQQELESAKISGHPQLVASLEQRLDQLAEAQKRMRAAVKVLEDEDSYEHDGNPIEQAIDLLAILSGGTDA